MDMDISMDIHVKSVDYGYGYGCEISYPRQPYKNLGHFLQFKDSFILKVTALVWEPIFSLPLFVSDIFTSSTLCIGAGCISAHFFYLKTSTLRYCNNSFPYGLQQRHALYFTSIFFRKNSHPIPANFSDTCGNKTIQFTCIKFYKLSLLLRPQAKRQTHYV